MLTFLAVAMAVVGAYSLLSDMFLRDRSRVSQRVDRELRKRQREQVRKSTVFKTLGATPTVGVSVVRTSHREKFESLIEQSAVSVTPHRLLALMAAAGMTLGLIAGLLHWNPLTGLAGFAVGASIPFLYVVVKRRRRLNKLM